MISLNSGTLNTETLNGDGLVIFGAQVSAAVINIEQSCTVQQVAMSIVDIEQEIILEASQVAVSVIDIEQELRAEEVSINVIDIAQRIVNAAAVDFYSRNGYELLIYIDNRAVDPAIISGTPQIKRVESDTSIASFDLLPGAGVIDLDLYDGKAVAIDVRIASGTHRVFTGIVDIPDIDLINERITINCVDKRKELINATPSVLNIGYWSDAVFGAARNEKEVAEELENRLSTVPYSVDISKYGTVMTTAWAAKATADYTLTSADVYRRTPKVIKTHRSRIINQVNIKAKYTYTRKYHQQKHWSWTFPIDLQPACVFLAKAPSMLRRDAVEAAARGAGWPIRSGITYTDVLANGFFNCDGFTVGWSTSSIQGTYTPQLDASGNQVTDPNGQNVQMFNPSGYTDYRNTVCWGAEWDGTFRWTQNILEEHTITVVAPQSTSLFGVVEQDATYTLNQDYNSQKWEDYKTYQDPPAGITDPSYYVDENVSDQAYTEFMTCALNRAKTTILKSHRDTRVIFQKNIWPQIDLAHTVDLTGNWVQGKGKVRAITHTFDINTGEAYTEVELAFSKSQGSTSPTTLNPPVQPSDTVDLSSGGYIILDSHYGEDPTGNDTWTGHVGNKQVVERSGTNNNYTRTQYPEAFIVDTPAIPDALRNQRTLAQTASYNVEVPNDALTIEFYS